MSKILYAINMKCTLKDGTTVEDVKGFVINNKRVYISKEDEVLTGDKKVQNIIEAVIITHPTNLQKIQMLENQ
tara:strand:- start:3163 stop:3381 length:219 start_codon:yes stop_codon:yes gene_type:complete